MTSGVNWFRYLIIELLISFVPLKFTFAFFMILLNVNNKGTGLNYTKTKLHEVTKLHENKIEPGHKISRGNKISRR